MLNLTIEQRLQRYEEELNRVFYDISEDSVNVELYYKKERKRDFAIDFPEICMFENNMKGEEDYEFEDPNEYVVILEQTIIKTKEFINQQLTLF